MCFSLFFFFHFGEYIFGFGGMHIVFRLLRVFGPRNRIHGSCSTERHGRRRTGILECYSFCLFGIETFPWRIKIILKVT